jgi:transcription termination factor Rho
MDTASAVWRFPTFLKARSVPFRQELKEKDRRRPAGASPKISRSKTPTMRKQDMMFAILKTLADEGSRSPGSGGLEVLQDGFGFLRSPDANYLPGPDDIYVSPSQIREVRPAHRRHGRRAVIRAPREGERYFALTKVDKDQLRGSRKRPPQGPLRQPDAALSR